MNVFSLLLQLAATLTNPFDVVKTRRQAFDSTAPVATMKDGKPAAPELTKTFPILFDIAKKEGWAGLMRGLTPRLAKVRRPRAKARANDRATCSWCPC